MPSGPRIDDAFSYHEIEAVFLENAALRVLVLPGKGGDVLEFRDKRTDVDVLFHTDHNWWASETRRIPDVDGSSFHDHYPGGWQVNLPVAGHTEDFDGTPYGLHGESALLPWDAAIVREDDEAVSLRLTVELARYPFAIERTLTLPAGTSRLLVEEAVTNQGRVPLEYMWQQHVALGAPLLGPAATLRIPAETGVVEAYDDEHANARLAADETFAWPIAPGVDGDDVDLREIPPPSIGSHDVAFATDLEAGWYTLVNPDIDLGFGFAFPTDPFECVWYWQPFHGMDSSPFFGRNYNVGLEPTTAYPSQNIPDAQRQNASIDVIDPGETVRASFVAVTFPASVDVAGIEPDGSLRPTD